MDRFDGTAARQLDLIDTQDARREARLTRPALTPRLRLLRRDVYAELERRRRRAQMDARHLLDQD